MYLIPEPISCPKEITFESHLGTPLTNAGLVTSANENPTKSTAAEVLSETLKNDKFADKTVVSISRPVQSSPHYQHQAPSSQQQTYHQQPQAQPQRQHSRYFIYNIFRAKYLHISSLKIECIGVKKRVMRNIRLDVTTCRPI